MPRAVDGQLQAAVDALQRRVDADPEIQAILQREGARLQQTHDRGGAARDYQQTIRDQITTIAKRKGYLPQAGQYFVNPNDGQLEPHGGWAGLSNKTRLAIIAAAATGGTLAAGALGVGPAAGMFGGGGATAGGATGAAAGGMPAGGMPFYVPGMGQALPPALAAENALFGAPGAASLITKGYNLAPKIPGIAGAAGIGGSVLDAVTRNGGREQDGGQSLLNRILGGLKKYGPLAAGLAIPTYAAWRGSRDKPPAEDQINQLLGIAQRRIEGSEPLYQALNTMAMAQLPQYVKENKG